MMHAQIEDICQFENAHFINFYQTLSVVFIIYVITNLRAQANRGNIDTDLEIHVRLS